MATTQAVVPRRKRSFFRFWLPRLIVAGGVGSSLALWFWPSDMERAYRVAGIVWLAAPLTVLLLLGWALVFSGWRWWARLLAGLGIPLVIVAAYRESVREVHFTGDMMPYFSFHWSPTPDQVREAHRRQETAADWTPGDLSGSRPDDFPEYRGRLRDGVVHGPSLARDRPQPAPARWRQPASRGYSGFAVAGNAAVTLEQRGDEEAVVCYDTATGQERWAYAYPAHFKEWRGGPGPRSTPTIADGCAYSLGAQGRLVCLDAASGKSRWDNTVNVLEDNANLEWGMSGSPLVYDNVVVVSPGAQTEAAQGRALIAYDRATGKMVWHAGSARGGYSSPMLATLGGRRQVLIFDGEGLAGHDDETGAELWRHPWTTQMGINVSQPIVLDSDRVFVSSAYNVGGALLRVTEKDGAWSVEPLWQNRNLRCKFTSPVLRQGHIYGLDDGVLACVDVETGQRRWREGRYGHGQLLLSDDLLVILGESGELALVEASPDGFRERGFIAALKGKTWNCPALAGGTVFVRNDQEMACYDLTGK